MQKKIAPAAAPDTTSQTTEQLPLIQEAMMTIILSDLATKAPNVDEYLFKPKRPSSFDRLVSSMAPFNHKSPA
jgi:hypothetical protein